MKTVSASLSLLMTLFLLCSGIYVQAQNENATREVSFFDEIAATGEVRVHLAEGPSEAIRIETENLSLTKVVTEVKGKKLKVKLTTGVYKKEQVADIYVTVPRIRDIRVGNGALLTAETPLTGDKIALSALAGGRIELEVNVNALDAKANEGGFLMVKGKCSTLQAGSTSGGVLDATALAALDVFATASLGGSTKVKAIQSIDAKGSSGGSVVYFGEPETESTSTSLGGTVERK